MTDAVRNGAVALLGIVLVALLLRFAPAPVAAWTGGGEGPWGEAGFTLAMFGPILLLGWVGRRGARIAGHGISPRGAVAGLAIGSGGLLLATGYTALAGTLVRGGGAVIAPPILLGLIVIAFQVAAEELFFRGWLQPLFARTVGDRVAIGLVATLFAGLHMIGGGASGAVPLLNLLLGGLMFGLIATGPAGLAGAVAAHFGWNAAEQLLLGLDPNPGIGAFGAVFDLDLIGAPRWGGSDQGLNGSWAMSLALLALVAALSLARWRKAADA